MQRKGVEVSREQGNRNREEGHYSQRTGDAQQCKGHHGQFSRRHQSQGDPGKKVSECQVVDQ